MSSYAQNWAKMPTTLTYERVTAMVVHFARL